MTGLAHPAGLAPEAGPLGQAATEETVDLILGIGRPRLGIERTPQQIDHPATGRRRHHGSGHHPMQQAGGEIGAEAVAVLQLGIRRSPVSRP